MAALLGAGLLWIFVTGLLARAELSRLQSRIESVRIAVAAGDIARARHTAESIPGMASRAHQLTTGPAWWAGSHVPVVGRPIAVTRGLTTATDRLGSSVIPDLVAVVRQIDPARLRSGPDAVALAPLVRAAPQLHRAAGDVHRVDRTIRDLSSHTWLAPVNTARDHFALTLTSVEGYVDAADRVAQVLPSMLGRDGPRRYFIALQNEAESRGTGGLPGAFAIVVATNGRIRFTHFENDSALLPAVTNQLIATGLHFGRGYDDAYAASQPTRSFVDSNVAPEFPDAARIWATMWQKVSGEHVDGALALDPSSLALFLAATGPASLPVGGPVSAANVVSLTQKDSYALYPSYAERKTFLVSVLRATARKITSGAGAATTLVQAASRSAAQRRLLVWTRDPETEKVIRQTDFAGAFPGTERPLAAPIVNNAAAGKLDYYLGRSFNYMRTGCGSKRDVLSTFSLTNGAPRSGLPTYVTTRLDRPLPPGVRPGDNHLIVDYFAIGGSSLQSVTVNGKTATAAVLSVNGRSLFRLNVEIPAGRSVTIALHLSEPAGKGAPVIWRQPGVTPLAIQEFNQSC